MREVVYSRTFDQQLADYVEHGEIAFGLAVATRKKDLVYSTIESVLARMPGIKRRHSAHGLVVYPISKTPFFVLYDYDATHLRVHYIFIKGKSLEALDPAEW